LLYWFEQHPLVECPAGFGQSSIKPDCLENGVTYLLNTLKGECKTFSKQLAKGQLPSTDTGLIKTLDAARILRMTFFESMIFWKKSSSPPIRRFFGGS
jgi:hypothetical protein